MKILNKELLSVKSIQVTNENDQVLVDTDIRSTIISVLIEDIPIDDFVMEMFFENINQNK